MFAQLFAQRQHALLNHRCVFAQQLQGVSLVQTHQHRAQQAAITGVCTGQRDTGNRTAQIGPVFGQGVAVLVHHLQHFIAGPPRQALQQQQLDVGAGRTQGVMLLHGVHKTVNLCLDIKAFPGVHQQGWSRTVVHVHMAQAAFIGMADAHDLLAHRVFKRNGRRTQPAQQGQALPLQRVFSADAPRTFKVVFQYRRIDPHSGGVLEPPVGGDFVVFHLKHPTVQRHVLFAVEVVKPQFIGFKVAGKTQVLPVLARRVVPEPNLPARLAHGRHGIAQCGAKPLAVGRVLHAQKRALVGL